MRVTGQLLYRGFVGRSLDEFKRLSRIAIFQEGIRTPSAPFPLIAFDQPSKLGDCKVFSDADTGGFSRVNMDFIPATEKEPAHAYFHGSISTQLPRDRPEIIRTGYAAWRTRDRPPTLFGRGLWDIDPYAYLALRVKSDGRKYLVNVQTESIVPTDIHQHRLYARRPGRWETILINWHEFVRTNHGVVVEPQSELLRQKVRTVGIGLTDRIPGEFHLRIQRMWATNGLTDEDRAEDEFLQQQEEKETIKDGGAKPMSLPPSS
ncbi:MAG: hypothetical protein M1823_002547 [Watsoniomyces obsoletus]|nr:MAG: hypothetical protein M1823_002547 [Watsoniomyces obsoletus]